MTNVKCNTHASSTVTHFCIALIVYPCCCVVQPTEVAAWGLVVSIHRDFAKALILGGGEESVSAGMSALHVRGHVPALDVREATEDQWAGGVFDALGRRLDPGTLRPINDKLPRPLIVPDAAMVAEAASDADAIAASQAAAAQAGCFPLLSYPPPSLAARSTTHRFLPTGLLHLDAFHPVAEGLRIGIMGSKRAGKSSLAACILSSFVQQAQRYEAEVAAAQSASGETALPPAPLPTPFHFIYVCVGQSRFDTHQLIQRLERTGALARCTVVVAAQDDPMGMQYLAPFFGATLSDYFRAVHGHSSFIVYDDLAAHGHILTQINRMYGYPILAPNFIHAKLLERTAPLHEGGVSSTALVLVETSRSDRTLDVNENLAGFVDHALWLDSNLASRGLFPAINCSSVLGRPAARYRPHVLRALTNVLSTHMLASERKANTSKWAAEFGLEVEEEDEALMQFKVTPQWPLRDA